MPATEDAPLESLIKVKLLSRLPAEQWLHQFPHGEAHWNRCRFIFEREATDYDWLVVYDDIPAAKDQTRNTAREPLACAADRTILMTTEPSTIKIYGNVFTRQFGAVVTSQMAWALPHPQRIYTQPALHWYFGVGKERIRPFDEIERSSSSAKTRDLSMVFSPKRQRHTLHHKRFDFMNRLMELMPEIDIYGRGARPLDDKAEALDDYRYHVAIENYVGPHHWTEKLADTFLGLALPFYCGCTNATDYFPPESFIPIDMNDPEGAARIIRNAIANNEYEKRLPAILEARRRVLYEHNFFALISRLIEPQHTPATAGSDDGVIYSRHALRAQSPLSGLRDVYGKVRALFVHQVLRKN